MIEANPHRRVARVFAFICYVIAGLLACVSVFFILAAAYTDVSQIRGVEGITNARMTVMVGSIFTIWVVMIALLGWRIQTVFGHHQRNRNDKSRGPYEQVLDAGRLTRREDLTGKNNTQRTG